MARIVSQDGKSIYNFANVLSVRCIGKSIKLMLQMPMYDPKSRNPVAWTGKSNRK